MSRPGRGPPLPARPPSERLTGPYPAGRTATVHALAVIAGLLAVVVLKGAARVRRPGPALPLADQPREHDRRDEDSDARCHRQRETYPLGRER